MFLEEDLPRGWVGQGERDGHLAEGKGVQLGLDGRGEEVLTLFRGERNQQGGSRH